MFALIGGGSAPVPQSRLLSTIVYDNATPVNPLVGNIRVDWTFQGPSTGREIEIYYDFGSGYVLLNSGIDPTLLQFATTVGDIIGFVSLDSTNFRVNLRVGGIDVLDSPQFDVPPYDGPP